MPRSVTVVESNLTFCWKFRGKFVRKRKIEYVHTWIPQTKSRHQIHSRSIWRKINWALVERRAVPQPNITGTKFSWISSGKEIAQIYRLDSILHRLKWKVRNENSEWSRKRRKRKILNDANEMWQRIIKKMADSKCSVGNFPALSRGDDIHVYDQEGNDGRFSYASSAIRKPDTTPNLLSDFILPASKSRFQFREDRKKFWWRNPRQWKHFLLRKKFYLLKPGFRLRIISELFAVATNWNRKISWKIRKGSIDDYSAIMLKSIGRQTCGRHLQNFVCTRLRREFWGYAKNENATSGTNYPWRIPWNQTGSRLSSPTGIIQKNHLEIGCRKNTGIYWRRVSLCIQLPDKWVVLFASGSYSAFGLGKKWTGSGAGLRSKQKHQRRSETERWLGPVLAYSSWEIIIKRFIRTSC